MNHDEISEFTHLGQPSVLSATPAKPRFPAPRFCEHTGIVCPENLDITEEEFSDL